MSSDSSNPVAQLRHDLRTPVNHILGYSEMLLEDAEDAGNSTTADDLRKIQSAAKTLLALIDSRIQEDLGSDPALFMTAPVSAQPVTEAIESEAPHQVHEPLSGHVLVVDDNAENREMLAKRLVREGLSVEIVAGGHEALAALASDEFDVVLLDVMMPLLDGYEVLRQAKENPATRNVPVIMISALDELSSVIRCIEAGAEDYLPKPFDPTLLRARLHACLEKKRLRDMEQRYLQEIEVVQRRLQGELDEAARYVRSTIPAPQDGPPKTEWKYTPSTELGGDAFGYHWIDGEHFAIYLLDVCGHGVGSALLSVAVMNVIRSASLANTDFRDPSAVLQGLNRAFPMERQNNMYFTIWYGVYHVPTRALRYSSAGHPPALLIHPSADGEPVLKRLQTKGVIVGMMPESDYSSEVDIIPPGSSLHVFSDGSYEVSTDAGVLMAFEDFELFMKRNASREDGLDRLYDWVCERHGSRSLDDDFSILRVSFDIEANQLDLMLTNSLEEIPPANEKIAHWLNARGASANAVHFVTLCVEEIVSNCIKYGYTDNLGHKIALHIQIGEGSVRIEICDDGNEFNPLAVSRPDLLAPIHERQIGGLGLEMVRKMADGGDYRREGGVNRLTFWKSLS